MAAPVVETHALGKTFGQHHVLRDVELRLLPGRAIFVVGANGSGKSTLLRILAGLSAPTSGNALIFGFDSRRLSARYRRRIGMLAHQSYLYPNLTARENLEFYAELYAVPAPRETAARWLERVGLERFAERRVRALSRGVEQRLAAARAMLAEPGLLLLDEPFASLDSEAVQTIMSLIRDAVARGASIVASAHVVPEVDDLEFEVFDLARATLTRRPPTSIGSEAGRIARLRSLLGR
jgi:heme exporter protein A